MRRHSLLIGLCVALIAGTPSFAIAGTGSSCAQFTRNLKVGMSGEDVRALQVMLNSSTSTQVSSDGAGSPGQETTYFGLRTKMALAIFQEMHAQDVLIPAGLTRGSGFFGVLTRGKLVSLCNTTKTTPAASIEVPKPVATSSTATTTVKVNATTTATTTTPTPRATTVATATPVALSTGLGFKSDTPVMISPSTHAAARGATVTISGIGFASNGNVVHLDDLSINASTTALGGMVSFVVPQQAMVGNHSLWVSGSNGETRKTYFVVTDANVTAPTITSITPDKGSKGTSVTIKGTGFLDRGNSVKTSYGTINDLSSSDGTTLQFTLNPNIPTLKKAAEIPIWLNVVNNNGVSGFVVFTLAL